MDKLDKRIIEAYDRVVNEKVDEATEEELNEGSNLANLASVVLRDALTKLGFKKVGQVMTASTKGTSPKSVLKQAQQLVDAINMVDKTKYKLKPYEGFIDIVEATEVNEARKIKVSFRVSPKGSKMRHYNDISQLSKDYDKESLKDANIDVIFNSVVVGNLEMSTVLNEIY